MQVRQQELVAGRLHTVTARNIGLRVTRGDPSNGRSRLPAKAAPPKVR
jgi:hypothetical protein